MEIHLTEDHSTKVGALAAPHTPRLGYPHNRRQYQEENEARAMEGALLSARMSGFPKRQ